MKLTKTVEQWLKELPESIRPMGRKVYKSFKEHSLSEAILYTNWIDSEEGSEFWCGLYESLKWAEEG